jgi:hypothetical protein
MLHMNIQNKYCCTIRKLFEFLQFDLARKIKFQLVFLFIAHIVRCAYFYMLISVLTDQIGLGCKEHKMIG